MSEEKSQSHYDKLTQEQRAIVDKQVVLYDDDYQRRLREYPNRDRILEDLEGYKDLVEEHREARHSIMRDRFAKNILEIKK